MKEIPSAWGRFPESVRAKLIEVTGAVLQVSDDSKWTGLHFLAIVDPSASWFDDWMMSYIGKEGVIYMMEKSGMASNLASTFVLGAARLLKGDWTEHPLIDGKTIFSGDVEYLHFLNVTRILSKMIKCKRGVTAFPRELSVNSFMGTLIKMMTKDAKLCSGKGNCEPYRIPQFVSQIIRDITESNYTVQGLLFQGNHISEIIQPIKTAIKGKDRIISDNSLITLAQALSQIAGSEEGLTFLVQGEEGLELLDIFVSVVKSKKQSHVFSQTIIMAFISLLSLFFTSYRGIDYISSHGFHLTLGQIKKVHLDGPNDVNWDYKINCCLLRLAVTSKGVTLLEESGQLSQSVELLEQLNLAKKETMLSCLATTDFGMTALCNSNWIEIKILELWGLLDCVEELNLDLVQYSADKALARLMGLFTNFIGLSACLEYERDRKRGTLTEFIYAVVLLDLNEGSDLFRPEESRAIGLTLFNHIIHNLDSCILLINTFEFIEKLKLQLSDAYICKLMIFLQSSDVYKRILICF